jgi:hypothetical protein
MVRRTLVIALFSLVVVALAAAPGLAYEATDSYPVDQHARLVEGSDPVVAVWSDGAGSLLAQRYTGAGAGPVRTLASGIVGLSTWHAAGDGTLVTVVWKAGTTVSATCVDVADGSAEYTPATVTVATDAQAVTLRGVGATVTPGGVVMDGAGGAYVWCSLSPTSTTQGVGDSLVNHISATGVLAQPAPGPLAANGTIDGMATTGDGDAFALLATPGRSRVAMRRYDATLTAEWTRSPYLFDPTSVASSEPIGILGGAQAAIAWREGSKVKVQRFAETGSPRFLTPPAVTMARVGPSETVKVAADGSGGLYLVAPSGTGLAARHVLVSGLEASWDPSALAGVGTTPLVYGLANNEAGDLFVVSGDGGAGALRGVSLLTYTGAWTDVGPASAPELYSGIVPDGVGGAWAMGNGSNASLWRISSVAGQLTFRPRAKIVQYGKSVTVSGYLTAAGGVPAGAGTVVSIGTVSSGRLSIKTTAQTGASGFYRRAVKPATNAVWSAAAGGTAADNVAIQVAPKVSLALSHLKAGVRLSEIFSGSVSPNHKGKKVLVQKAVGKDWKTVASGRLDSRSRYRITWYLPYKTATYKLRTIIPGHADHAQGTSQTATLRVVIRKG